MSEKTTDNAAGNQSSAMGVPVAIVIAGGLIAAAVYFGGGRAPVAAPIDEDVLALEEELQGEVAGQQVGDMKPIDDSDHIRGPADAKITLVEYSDTECPFCKRFHTTLLQVAEEYPNDVRWVYRHFPLEQLHSKAKTEANALECAGEQGKFWEMLDLIFETTPGNDGLDLEKLPAMAQQVGVANGQQFETCLEEEKYAAVIEEDILDAQTAGGRGTPYTVVMNQEGETRAIPGALPYENVKQVIEELL